MLDRESIQLPLEAGRNNETCEVRCHTSRVLYKASSSSARCTNGRGPEGSRIADSGLTITAISVLI